METVTQVKEAKKIRVLTPCPSNDNRHQAICMGRSVLPDDAVARIYRPARSVMTSARVSPKGWRLVFERRTVPFIEPLMGYSGSHDTLTQVELTFPTLESAIRYAERQGIAYVVQRPPDRTGDASRRQGRGSTHAFSDTVLDRLRLATLRESDGQALDEAANRKDPLDPRNWDSPMDVSHDASLPLGAERSILMNWAWTEHLVDQATKQSMPEYNRPSRLAADRNDTGARKAA